MGLDRGVGGGLASERSVTIIRVSVGEGGEGVRERLSEKRILLLRE